MSKSLSILDQIDAQGDRLAKAESDLYDLTTALSHAFDGTAKMTADGKFLYVNDLYAANFGYTTRDLKNMSWETVTVSEDRSAMARAIEDCKEKGREEIEAKGLRKDGSIFWKKVALVRIPAELDQPYRGYYAFVRNISDSKRWATELQHSEQRFSTLVRDISAIVWIRDTHGMFSENQPSWGEFTGQCYDDYVGMGWINAVEEKSKSRVSELWALSVLNKTRYEIEYRLLRHDGKYRDMYVRAVPVLEADESVREWIGCSEDITEQKLTNQRFLTLTNAMPQIVWTTDPDTNVDYYNQKWYDYTGTDPLDLIKWEKACHPDELDFVREQIQLARSPDRSFQLDFRLKGADGEYRWFLARCLPVFDSAGETQYWVGTSTDIDEQKRDKEAFQVSELRKKAILDAALESIVTIDSEGEIIEWNKAAEATFGYSVEEAIGANISELIIPEKSRIQYSTGIAEYLKTGKSSMLHTLIEMPAICKNGKALDTELTIVPILAGGKQLFTSYIRDITEKKLTDKLLRLRERTLASAANGIVITDCSLPDEPIIYCNPAFEKLTGYTQEDIIGKNCRFLQGPKTNKSSIKRLRDAIKNRQSCRVRILNYRKDKTTFWNELTISPVLDDKGECTNYIGVQYQVEGADVLEVTQIQHDSESKINELP